MTDDHLVLSMLADGEAVDPEALARALRSPGAIDTLVSFAGLRQRLRSRTELPGDGFYRRWQERTSTGFPTRRRWPAAARSGVIAASLVLAVLTGVWIGTARRSSPLEQGPPTPTYVFHVATDSHTQDIVPDESRQP